MCPGDPPGPRPCCASGGPTPSLGPDTSCAPGAPRAPWAPTPAVRLAARALPGPRVAPAPAAARWSKEAGGDAARADTRSGAAEALSGRCWVDARDHSALEPPALQTEALRGKRGPDSLRGVSAGAEGAGSRARAVRTRPTLTPDPLTRPPRGCRCVNRPHSSDSAAHSECPQPGSGAVPVSVQGLRGSF